MQQQVFHVVAEGVAEAGQHAVAATACRLLHHVIGVVYQVGVIPCAPRHQVGTGLAIQPVGAVVADKGVVFGVARAINIGTAREGQVFQVGAQGIADAAEHLIDAFTGGFFHHVGRAVDHIAVIAGTTAQGVHTGSAIQDVVAAVAREQVGGGVARRVDVGAAREFQLFDVGRQGGADRGAHAVQALAVEFDHHIVDVVHHIAVVAQAAHQSIGARAAVQHVAAAIAFDAVGQFIAGGVEGLRARQREVFDLAAQAVADVGNDFVDAFRGVLADLIASVVHPVGVVTQATRHGVGAQAAIQEVGTVITGQYIGQHIAGGVEVVAALQLQVFYLHGQGVADAGFDGVCAGTGQLLHAVEFVVDAVEVVPQSAQ